MLLPCPYPELPISFSASLPSQTHTGGAPKDTHGFPRGSLGAREAPGSRWPFLPKGSQWPQLSLQEVQKKKVRLQRRDVSPQSMSLGPLHVELVLRLQLAWGQLRDIWATPARSPTGQYLTLAPSLPSRPGRPCSPGGPGGPGGPLSPRGPASPVFPWRGRRLILNGGGLGWGSV